MVRSTLMLAILLLPASSSAIDFTPLVTCSPSGSSFHCLYDEAALSPDQQWILVTEALVASPSYEYWPGVHLRSRDGNTDLRVGVATLGLSESATWSPRGDVVAYRASNYGDPTGAGLYLQRVELGASPLLAVPALVVADASAAHPSWSLDGSFLAYDIGGGGIWIVPVLGGSPTQVVTDGRAPHWGPDHRIVFERGGDLWIRDSLGETRQLTATPYHEVQPAWSPLGDWIAFASDEAGTWDIWVVSSRGGTRVRVTTDKHDAVHPSWSSDGSALVFTTQSALGPDTIWMATGLPDFTVSVERQPWGAIKQMYR